MFILPQVITESKQTTEFVNCGVLLYSKFDRLFRSYLLQKLLIVGIYCDSLPEIAENLLDKRLQANINAKYLISKTFSVTTVHASRAGNASLFHYPRHTMTHAIVPIFDQRPTNPRPISSSACKQMLCITP